MNGPVSAKRVIEVSGSRALAVELATKLRDVLIAEAQRSAQAAAAACADSVRAVVSEAEGVDLEGAFTWSVSGKPGKLTLEIDQKAAGP